MSDMPEEKYRYKGLSVYGADTGRLVATFMQERDLNLFISAIEGFESKVQQMIDEAVKISQARMHSAIFEVENNPDFNYSEHMNMLENELRQVFNTDNGRD